LPGQWAPWRLIIQANWPVDSVVIGCSEEQPDGHGVDREPVTPAADQAQRSLINAPHNRLAEGA